MALHRRADDFSSLSLALTLATHARFSLIETCFLRSFSSLSLARCASGALLPKCGSVWFERAREIDAQLRKPLPKTGTQPGSKGFTNDPSGAARRGGRWPNFRSPGEKRENEAIRFPRAPNASRIYIFFRSLEYSRFTSLAAFEIRSRNPRNTSRFYIDG